MRHRLPFGLRVMTGILAVLFLMAAVPVSRMEVRAEGETATQEKPEEEKTEEEKAQEALQKELEAVYNLPVQSNELKGWPQGPGTYGDSAIVMDADSGAILYAKNIDNQEFPASITKVLTALLAFQYGDMAAQVVITPECMNCLGSGYASIGLQEGNVISMEQAMYAMLLASSNEVACAIGETIAQSQGQSYEWFLEQMNATCRELGGEHSNFVNTNGVHEENHLTCARDMALIGRAICQYPQFFEICQTQQYVIPASATTEEHVFQQKHNMLLPGDSDYYEYAIGGKTGYTTEANNTLITFADNGDRTLICVVFRTYAGHVYSDTRALLDYGFSSFKKIPIVEKESIEEVEEIPEEAYVLLPEGVNFDSLEKTLELDEKGENLATLSYTYQDMPVGSAQVRVSDSLEDTGKVVFSEVDTDKMNQPEGKKDIRKPLIVVGIVSLLIILILWFRINQLKKRKRRRRRRRR